MNKIRLKFRLVSNGFLICFVSIEIELVTLMKTNEIESIDPFVLWRKGFFFYSCCF